MKGRGGLVVACLALIGVLFLAVFPVRTYVAQQRQQQALAERVTALAAENRQLGERAAVLHTDAEVERLAREQYGLVRPGEEVYAVLGTPPAPPPPPPPPAPVAPHEKRWWEKALDAVTSVL
ncbi:MAG: septum formation initiator family protein [Actinomycetota bacterium]|nr:septum formation initiator family protein [Actinomycetota bacterium]